jgi:hypothetical protein
MNPDSTVEIETEVRVRRKPGAAKTQKRIVSRSSLALVPPLRCVARHCSMHRSERPLGVTGPLSSPWRAYAERSALLPSTESGIKLLFGSAMPADHQMNARHADLAF